MFVKSYTSTLVGVEAMTVAVEVNVSQGIGFSLVGLPDNAVKESQERIHAAFGNSGFRSSGRRMVINLAPADLRKEGAAYDLPMAVAMLAATEQLPEERLSRYVVLGELSLDGTVVPVRGALPVAIKAREEGFEGVVVPLENAHEAAVVDGLTVVGVKTLTEAVMWLAGGDIPHPIEPETVEEHAAKGRYDEDFSDVKGQAHAKRALEIAAAGGHNVLMIGSPGSGKTMLARRMPTIMPPLSRDEALETTRIHSVAGKLGTERGLLQKRPFRAPHHLASRAALVGGGSNPQPGEISLAHNGILFLDEMAEFSRDLLEVLRQPLEDKKITVSRVRYSVDYPANFTLVASMNPCPCGYYNHPTRECVCSPAAVAKYAGRISGPLMDRIDMHIEVTPVTLEEIGGGQPEESSATILERVMRVREIQRARFADCPGIHTNAMMNSKMLRDYCPLSPETASILERAMNRLNLSARAYDRIIKLARTIADLDAVRSNADRDAVRSNSDLDANPDTYLNAIPDIAPRHIAEAINYRTLDRENWGTMRK